MSSTSDRSFTSDTTLDLSRMLTYLPLAMGAYGTGSGTTAVSVGTNIPVELKQFNATSPAFQAGLYRDSATGKYTISIAGTNDLAGDVIADLVLAGQDLRLPNWHAQYSDALNFAFEAVKQIATDLRTDDPDRQIALNDIRAVLDVTGHSLGGALAELVAEFFGLSGANIDGPGVSFVTTLDNYSQMQDQVREVFPDLASNYDLAESQFSSHAVSVVGMAGTHVDGVHVEATEEAQTTYALAVGQGALGSVPGASSALVAGGLATAGIDAAIRHPSAGILERIEEQLGISPSGPIPAQPYTMLSYAQTDAHISAGNSTTLTSLSLAVAGRFVEGNVQDGLSPMGLPLDGTATQRGIYSVIAYRNEHTGRIEEIYTAVDAEGHAIAAPIKREYVVDSQGRVGEFDAEGGLHFVVHDAASGFAGVATVGTDGVVRIQGADGQGALSAVSPDSTKAMMNGQVDWLDTIMDEHPLAGAFGDSPSMVLDPVSYDTVIHDGHIYTVGEHGTLDRALPDHPGWTESRDSTGGGVILDAEGNAIAQLQAGDRVGQMDDGRIVVTDGEGNTVNRLVDDAMAGQFSLGVDFAVPNPYDFGNYLEGAGAGLSASQQQGLAAQLDSLNLGGSSDLSFITLPGGGTTLIQNADGDIVGEIQQDAMGYVRVSAVRIHEDGSAEPVVSYVGPSGEVIDPDAYAQAQSTAQAQQTAAALGLLNSIIGLQNWDAMSDLQRTAALAGIYNTVDHLTGGGTLPGDLGTAAGVLGLLNALDQGNVGGVVYSGLSLVESLTATSGIANSGLVSDALGGNFLPALGFVLALDSGDPWAIGSSGVALLTALEVIPVWGQALAVAIAVFGAFFQEDIPMREGLAHAEWDAQGQTHVVTDLDEEGGGATATGWMQALAEGLQERLDGSGYALVPGLLPAVGFKYDPDGFNLRNGAKGFLYLEWTDEDAQVQTRYYDGAGNRGDGSGETLAGDFVRHAMGAIAPAWAVETALAHWQQGEGLSLPQGQDGLPQETADGLQQQIVVLTLALPDEPALRAGLVDVDGDGYLEQTPWVAANQQMLAIDANGDGLIGAGELLNLGDADALNSVGWLDANGDGRLDAKDPAFAALRLWMDVNGDGLSGGETQTFGQAGIAAIDFSGNPPAIVREDGSRQALTAQTLNADVRGAAYQAVAGGILQIREQADGSGVAVLMAANTREFDGQAGHVHGGDADTDGGGHATVDAGNAALQSTSARTPGTENVQAATTLDEGDGRIRAGASGSAQTGQGSGQREAAPGSTSVRSNGIVFVPAQAQGAAAQMREVTAGMVRGAQPGPFGAGDGMSPLLAVAVGAAAQWPAVVGAQEPDAADEPDEAAVAGVIVPAQLSPSGGVGADGSSPALAAGLDGAVAAQPGSDSVSLRLDADAAPLAGPEAGNASGAVPLADMPRPATGEAPASATTSGDGPAPASKPPLAYQAADGDPGNDGASSGTGSAGPVDFPSVAGEHARGTEDVGLRFAESALLANDATANAPPAGRAALAITSVFAPQHGSVSLQATPAGTEVVFIPDAGYHGPASFSYTVSDAYGLSRTAAVTLELEGVNDAPVTRGESAAGDEDHALMFSAASLLANDRDPDTAVDGDVLRITRVGAAEHGQVFLLADGTVRFVPEADYNGPARFSYWVGDRDPDSIASGEGRESEATVSLTVLPVNDLPVVAGEEIDSDEDVVLSIAPGLLLANDRDVDGATDAQVLTITAVGGAQHGEVALLPDGSIRFTPERDYAGAASFAYTVDDGHGGRVQGTAVIHLAPVNDAPVVVGETIAFDEDEIQTIDAAALLANDSDVDNPHTALRIVAVDNATHGTVALDANGAIRFVPEADYFGAASFTYTVADGAGGFTVGTASLEIAPVNDAPRLVGEQVALDEDTVARFTQAALLANDLDVDDAHSALSVSAVGGATHGTVTLANGEIVFKPDADFNGRASFTYTVTDGSGGSSEATVELDFAPVNDAPVANDELLWGKQGVTYTLTQAALLANDTDAEDPADLRVVGIDNVQHGSAVLNADGSVTFTPEAGYAGRGSFNYVVQDPDGARSTAEAQIDFSHVNVNPTATDDSFIGYEDVAFSIAASQLLVNDSDADNAAADLRVTGVANAVNGTVSMDADGNVSFAPAADFHGTASFQYQVSDPEGGQTWATAYLNVQSVNDAPIIEDIWYGRPIYGYRWEVDTMDPRTPFHLVAVEDEATALALFSDPSDVVDFGSRSRSNDLMDANGNPIGVSYYLNGHLRPIAFDTLDGTQPPRAGPSPVDSPYRESGAVIAYDPDGDSGSITFSLGATPQHGLAWANQYVPASVLTTVDHTAINNWIVETGAWQYYSFRGDTYSGADPFTIVVTDSEGASTSATIAATHAGSSPSGGGSCPIVIDLRNDGIELLRPEDSSVFMDINGDGWRDRIGWAAPSDAVLAFDADGDGRVDIDTEVSFAGYLPGARTDLEGLAAFDTDGDGRLTAQDGDWSRFGLFQDRNGNGLQDEGEFVSLDAAGLVGIDLARQGEPAMNNGNVVFGTSAVQWADGRTSQAGDVMFAGEGIALPQEVAQLFPVPQPEADAAAIQRVALLFNQAVNTAVADDARPLAFVSMADDVRDDGALLAQMAVAGAEAPVVALPA